MTRRRAGRPEEGRRAEVRPVRVEGNDGAEAMDLRWCPSTIGGRGMRLAPAAAARGTTP